MSNISVTAPTPWKVAVAAGSSLALALGIGRFAYTPLLPMMQSDQGLSLEAGSWVAMLNMLGYLLGAMSGKRLTHQPVRFARLSWLCLVVTMFGMALSQSVFLWGTWRLLAGVASAWMMITVSVVTLPRLQGSSKLAGFVYGGAGVGIAMSGILCVAFVTLSWESPAGWAVFGAVTALLGAPLWTVFQASWDKPRWRLRQEAAHIDQGRGGVESNSRCVNARRMWILVICYGFFGFAYILPATYLPVQARQLLGDSWTYSMAWPFFGLAAAVSSLVAASVAKRLGLLRTWAGAQAVLLLGVVAPLLWSNMGGILFAALCVGGTLNAITLMAMQDAHRHAGMQAGVWMARLTAAFALGQVLGPGTILLLQGDLELGLLVAGVALAFSVIGLGWQQHRDRVWA